MSKYDFKGAKIQNNDGTFAIGENQTISNVVNKGSSNGELEELFTKLAEEIHKLSTSDEVEDAIDNVGKLKTAIEQDDQPRAKKLFSWLPTAVQASATAVEIFKLITAIPQS